MIVNDSKKLQKVADVFLCNFCDYSTCKKYNYEKHLTTDKHKMVVNDSEKLQKVADIFYCKNCDYSTCRKSSYYKHLITSKHQSITKVATITEQKVAKVAKVANHMCICGKSYKHDSGYYRHKQKCNVTNNSDEITNKELIIALLKQNSELIEQNTELVKNVQINNTINSHNINSHNKTFNLQFFLNETCKDAMNITDFVNSIKLQLSDLEKVGKIGYVEGISNIINTNLKALDVTQRPIHCSDKKREILYIKDKNKWEKEDNDKTKIRKAIKQIAHKNSMLISKFKEVYPDCGKSISKYSDQYNKLIIESMGGSGVNEEEKENKIIKNITKITLIEKN
jgi:hypothetical protein